MPVNKVQKADGEVLVDLTNDTVTPETLLAGYTAHAANGARISGAIDWNTKQDKEDDELNTEAKTIVGAINELDEDALRHEVSADIRAIHGKDIIIEDAYGPIQVASYAINPGSYGSEFDIISSSDINKFNPFKITNNNFTVDDDEFISSNMVSDPRPWNFSQCDCKITLDSGVYVISWDSEEFASGAALRVLNSSNEQYGYNLTPNSKYTSFTLSEPTEIGVFIKLYTSKNVHIMINNGTYPYGEYVPFATYRFKIGRNTVFPYFIDNPMFGNNVHLYSPNSLDIFYSANRHGAGTFNAMSDLKDSVVEMYETSNELDNMAQIRSQNGSNLYITDCVDGTALLTDFSEGEVRVTGRNLFNDYSWKLVDKPIGNGTSLNPVSYYKENTRYLISCEIKQSDTGYGGITVYYTDGTIDRRAVYNLTTEYIRKSYITRSNKTIEKILVTDGTKVVIKRGTLIIEEVPENADLGSFNVEYVPYHENIFNVSLDTPKPLSTPCFSEGTHIFSESELKITYPVNEQAKAITEINDIASSVKTLVGTDFYINDSTTVFDNAGSHNSIYRGKYLGDHVTDDQYEEIGSGRFRDLYIGDYWTIGGVTYRIAAFDYYYGCGDTAFNTHHAVIVPDGTMGNCQFHNTASGAYESGAANTTEGGYVGSDLYKGKLYDGTTKNAFATAKDTINAAFSDHVRTHRIYLTNVVANGKASAGAWCDSTIDLMCEQMVYGSGIFSPVSDGTTIPINYRVEKSQLPLFQHDPSKICNRVTWWLRDVVSDSKFANVGSAGPAYSASASNPRGVCPAFCISK